MSSTTTRTSMVGLAARARDTGRSDVLDGSRSWKGRGEQLPFHLEHPGPPDVMGHHFDRGGRLFPVSHIHHCLALVECLLDLLQRVAPNEIAPSARPTSSSRHDRASPAPRRGYGT